MPLNPRIQIFLQEAGLLFPVGSAPRAPEVLLAASRAQDEPSRPMAPQTRDSVFYVAKVEDLLLPGPLGDIPARLYTPEGRGPFPLIMYFHGGGWVAGNLNTHDGGCRYYCHATGSLVLAVDYRRPPEYKFPVGLEDCYAATCWMKAHAAQFQGDPKRIAIVGDSGGGNFAAVIALMSRDRGEPPLTFQLLLVPVLDFDTTTSSWQESDGYMMNKAEFLVARDLYLSSEEEQYHPYAAPLLAPDLHALPPALIITAECDPVRDAAERYGQRLLEAGIPTTISRYNGMPHGFMSMQSLAPLEVGRAFAETTQALRTALRPPDPDADEGC